MNAKQRKESYKMIRNLRNMTDRICQRYPQAERSHVYHTLLLLKKEPLERLNLALIRAEKKTLHI